MWSLGAAFGSYMADGSIKIAFLVGFSLFWGAVMSHIFFGANDE
jgi:hypothetical protein